MNLTEHDRAELEKFKRYIRACVKWDQDHGLREIAAEADMDRWLVVRPQAHAKIYHDIYGREQRTGSCHVPE